MLVNIKAAERWALPHLCFPNLMGKHMIGGVYLCKRFRKVRFLGFQTEVEKGSLEGD